MPLQQRFEWAYCSWKPGWCKAQNSPDSSSSSGGRAFMVWWNRTSTNRLWSQRRVWGGSLCPCPSVQAERGLASPTPHHQLLQRPWLTHRFFTPDTRLVWLSPLALPLTALLVPTRQLCRCHLGGSADAGRRIQQHLRAGSNSQEPKHVWC